MRYSTRTRYGLRFLINLADGLRGPVSSWRKSPARKAFPSSISSRSYASCALRVFCVPHAGPREGMRLRNPRTPSVWTRSSSVWKGTFLRWNACTGQKAANGKASAPQDGSGGSWMITCGCFSRGMTLARFVERERALKTEKGTFPVDMDGPACFHALHRTPPEGGGNA